MKAYADTNFFTNLLLNLPFTAEADRLLNEWSKRSNEPLPVTRLLHHELVNAFQRLVYESKNGSPGYTVTAGTARAAEASFELEIQQGQQLSIREPDSRLLDDLYYDLVYRHTAKHGFRTNDVLHVASALILGCDTFWSFDTKARKLAELEGLTVN